MSQEFLKIVDLLNQEKAENIGIFTHQNADPDSVSSAIGLKYLLEKYLPTSTIYLFSHTMSTLSKKLLDFTDDNFLDNIDKINLDAIFLCDTNNLNQIGGFSLDKFFEKQCLSFVIDHHSHHEFTDQVNYSIIKQLSSTAEILSQIYIALEITPPPEIATLFLTGMIFDSRRFRYISPTTFSTVEFLINNGGDYEKAITTLQSPMTVSEKMARLKGAARSLHHKEGEDIYSVSYISSYESSVARSLVGIGTDFAAVIALNNQDKEIRMSLRCSVNFATKNKVNLGDLANNIANKFQGSGGGHLTAAGMNIKATEEIPSNKEKLLEFMLKLILNEIKKK
jgi:nanoRNase/pAp phosphatase (c-di-AMP/oligoRNAs hydrolase)